MTNPAEEFPTQAPAPPAQASAPPPALSPAFNDPRRKKPFLASVLSIMPGLGQVYVGYYKQGFVNAITVALLISFITLQIMALIPLAAIFLAFFWLYNIVDAGRRAGLYNQALAGGGDIALPDSFEPPSLGGSLAGGGALIVIGLVLLSHTLWGASLAWLEDWWPLALVGCGGWLVYKAVRERSGGGDESFE
jgi:TM2 domain-containing membrane protein YozV